MHPHEPEAPLTHNFPNHNLYAMQMKFRHTRIAFYVFPPPPGLPLNRKVELQSFRCILIALYASLSPPDAPYHKTAKLQTLCYAIEIQMHLYCSLRIPALTGRNLNKIMRDYTIYVMQMRFRCTPRALYVAPPTRCASNKQVRDYKPYAMQMKFRCTTITLYASPPPLDASLIQKCEITKPILCK